MTDHVTNWLTRREALAAAGLAGAAALLGCGDDDSGERGASGAPRAATSADPTTAADGCVLTPEATEGPYHIDLDGLRSDITEDRDGTPLRLELTVQNASSCEPIAGATVEIWHADADGAYSGFDVESRTAAAPGPPVGAPPGPPGVGAISSTRFLRGAQRTDRRGGAAFKTIYPGWYEGRATHVHVKVHVEGEQVHTGQLFFPDDLNARVFAQGAYADRGQASTTNDRDSIFASAGGDEAIPSLRRSGDGFIGAVSLGVRV